MVERRVLALIPALTYGGAESLLFNFAGEFSRRAGWGLEVCTLMPGDRRNAEFEKSGVLVHGLNWRHRYQLAGHHALRNLLSAGNFQIVHSHLFPANLAAALSREASGARFVLTEHSVRNRRRNWRMFKALDRYVYRRFEKIVCVSASVEKSVLEWVPDQRGKTVVITNGIPVFPSDAVSGKIYDVLCVASLNRRTKGVDVLLHALATVPGSFGHAVIAGDGRLRPELEQLRDELGLTSRVHFLGAVRDVRSLMRQARVFVVPSRWEGLPMAMLEAMEASLPIVATAVGGIPEVIRDAGRGLLVPAEDAIALGSTIARVLQDEGLGESLGRGGRRALENQFSIVAHVNAVIALYEQLLTD